MKIFLWMVCISTYAPICFSQKFVDVSSVDSPIGQGLYYTINGEPFVSARFSRVTEGSPYVNNDFIKGSIVLSGGREYKDVPVKINILDGTLLYLNQKNEEMESTVPVRKIVIPDAKTGKMQIFLHSDFTCSRPQKTWYQLLDSGKAVLLKFDKRIMKENKPYGSATTEQIIHSRIEYLLIHDNQCIAFKTRKDLEQILQESYPSFVMPPGNNSKGKGEEGMIEAIQYLNAFLNKTN